MEAGLRPCIMRRQCNSYWQCCPTIFDCPSRKARRYWDELEPQKEVRSQARKLSLLVNPRLRANEPGVYFLEFSWLHLALPSGGRQSRVAQWFPARRDTASTLQRASGNVWRPLPLFLVVITHPTVCHRLLVCSQILRAVLLHILHSRENKEPVNYKHMTLPTNSHV